MTSTSTSTSVREITSRLVWDTEEKGPEGYRYILVKCSYPDEDGGWVHSLVFPVIELERAHNPDIYVGRALLGAQTFMVNAVMGIQNVRQG